MENPTPSSHLANQNSQWQATACILCSRNCGIEIQVQEGRLNKIRGDKNHPLSQGYLCQKAMQLDYYQNHSDRLDSPLKRKPDGSYEKISWDQAISEIAAKLVQIRDEHGGETLAYYGGGSQANHLGGVYGLCFRTAMQTRYWYQAIAQEKTGDAWVNGRLFGRQNTHTSEDIEHSDYVVLIGTNSWVAHGIRNARQVLKEIAKDPHRTLAVIDPRRTETAEMADLHLALRPGTDAFLLSAILGVIFQEKLENAAFLKMRTTGFEEIKASFLKIDVDEFSRRAGIDPKQTRTLARGIANARNAVIRVDLGIQQSLNSTLNSYLEKLLFLVTGNFGKKGANNLHTWFVPIAGHSEDANLKPKKPSFWGRLKHIAFSLTRHGELLNLLDPKNAYANPWKTQKLGMPEIAKVFPPTILPLEIDSDHPKRLRGLVVDSANPVVTSTDSAKQQAAFKKLELLVVIDVAFTETARLAHYVLPASSQFEKWEMSFFNLEFPSQFIQLRRPILEPHNGTLPEAEIYSRLILAMGEIPESFPILEKIAKWSPYRLFPLAFMLSALFRPKWFAYLPMVLFKTLGKTLPSGAESTAVLWSFCHLSALQHRKALRRAGWRGFGLSLGNRLFRALTSNPSGIPLSTHRYEDTWALIRHRDRKVHLLIPEMLEALKILEIEKESVDHDYPLVLIAGERRSYNANTILRDPRWRKEDPDGALRIHPEDAKNLGLENDDSAYCESKKGRILVRIRFCERTPKGVVTLPHGYGTRLKTTPEGRDWHTVDLNQLTDLEHRDPISATPYYKHVCVRLFLANLNSKSGF